MFQWLGIIRHQFDHVTKIFSNKFQLKSAYTKLEIPEHSFSTDYNKRYISVVFGQFKRTAKPRQKKIQCFQFKNEISCKIVRCNGCRAFIEF